MGGFWVFASFCGIFRTPSSTDVSAHFSALDDEEFFVVEASGWLGRRESDSQVFCHPNSLHALALMDKHGRHTSCPRPSDAEYSCPYEIASRLWVGHVPFWLPSTGGKFDSGEFRLSCARLVATELLCAVVLCLCTQFACGNWRCYL